jgi:uncharacterized DUF497 family protein
MFEAYGWANVKGLQDVSALEAEIARARIGDEERWVSVGIDKSARLLVVCHTYREITQRSATIRIFSVRKSTRRETREYQR